MRKYFLVFLLVFILSFGLYYFNDNSCDEWGIYTIVWNSMAPTLQNWTKVCLDDNYYDINSWDIVAFEFKNSWKYVKRVVARPKDKVKFWKDWYIYINEIKQQESYIKTVNKYNSKWIYIILKQLENYNNIVPDGMYLVLWDNRFNSADSSSYWLIDEAQIFWKIIK